MGREPAARLPPAVHECTWCRRIRNPDDSWSAARRRADEARGAVVNTICPDCFGEVVRGAGRGS